MPSIDNHSNNNDIANFSKLWNTIQTELSNSNVVFDQLMQEDSLTEQIKAEFVLQLIDKISICTSNRISGAQNFLRQTEFPDSEKDLTYNNKATIQRLLKRFHICANPTPFVYITGTSPYDNESISFKYRYPIERSDLIIDKTPLSDYLYTHILIHDPAPSMKQRYKFEFHNDSRYFLSVLLRAVNSGTIPYTTNSQNGISLKSLDNFFKKLHLAYHTNTLKENTIESFLFLYNSENIFHESFLYTIFDSYTKLFFNYSKRKLLNLYTSLEYLKALENFPYDSVRIFLWNKNIKTFFSDNEKAENFYKFMEETEQFGILLNTLTEKLSEQILQDYGYSGLDTQDNILTKIRSDLLTYLKNLTISVFSWSNLTKPAYSKIQPLSKDYFNFYITYIFYSSNGFSSPINYFKNLIDNNDLYLTYLMQCK